MPLKCEVNVVLRPEPGCYAMNASRASRAVIRVCQKWGSQSKNAQINMLISTNKNRNSTMFQCFQLSGNILRLYAPFVDEGKGTISLFSPAQDICISKADPIQLKSLLTVLRQVAKGVDVSKTMSVAMQPDVSKTMSVAMQRDVSKTMSVAMQPDVSKTMSVGSVQPPSTHSMKALQTVMQVLYRQDYPLTTSFPPSLQKLMVFGCAMKHLDPRILDLHHLRILNLSNNLLTSLPENLGCWTHLSDLDLSRNQLTSLPPALYSTCVKDSLSVLNLNDNSLTQLPLQLCEIRGLVQLHVSRNKLSALPPTIGSMSRLLIITAQNNQITQLHGSLAKLRLELLNLYGNPIQQLQNSVLLSSNLGMPSLVELTSRSIRKERLAYSEEDVLPHLVHYLNNARQCWCGQYCFESCASYLHSCELSQFSNTVEAWNKSGATIVPVEVFLCSATCLQKFQSNPFDYWR